MVVFLFDKVPELQQAITPSLLICLCSSMGTSRGRCVDRAEAFVNELVEVDEVVVGHNGFTWI